MFYQTWQFFSFHMHAPLFHNYQSFPNFTSTMTDKPLKIYKASAGSGKTYKLTLQYLVLLFKNPNAYKRILAVTFTNKASSEMKQRIIEKLFELSGGGNEARDYREYLLKNKLVKDEAEIREKAARMLSTILNDYSGFYVETIDKFFQRVIRGFTREIGLQNSYNLELNTGRVLAEAIDLLLLGMDEDEDLKQWLVQFAEENLLEGKSWNIHSDVLNLAQEVFKESYQSIHEEVADPAMRKELFNSFRSNLLKEKAVFENFLKTRAVKALKIIEQGGLEISDFKYGGSSIPNIFKKIVTQPIQGLEPGVRPERGLDNPEEWFTKNSEKKAEIIAAFENGLNQLLNEILKYWNNNKTRYFTVHSLWRNLYTFGILNNVSERINEITREKNIFLLADASLFLKRIIAENEAPFIYEKAGNYFDYFMLDEFQDTSRFQWNNFKPLIADSLASNHLNLLVGDVKQSIYRWRNSDWKILAHDIKTDFSEDWSENILLDSNYRSLENIIRFNNSVFYESKNIIRQLIEKNIPEDFDESFKKEWINLIDEIYGKSGQNIPNEHKKEKGLVKLNFFRELKSDENLEILKSKLPKLICELQDRNYRAGDIAILVRKKQEGSDIANLLMEAGHNIDSKYNFKVISNDSLYIGNNPANRFLISLLKYFNQPDDLLNNTFLKNEYTGYLSESGNNWTNDHHSLFSAKVNEGILIEKNVHFTELNKELPRLKTLALYELVEELIRIFHLNEHPDNLAFIQALQDEVLEFLRKESADISSFLRYWEDAKLKSTLQVSEAQDAIRIITIHKAKGLQFKTVIIPFLDWKTGPETSGNMAAILWPSIQDKGFSEFSHYPVVNTSKLKDTLFTRDYHEEMFRSYVDNLNLAYVAFTRAENELHVYSNIGKETDHPKTIGDLIFGILQKETEPIKDYPGLIMSQYFDRDALVYSQGESNFQEKNLAEISGEITTYLDFYPVKQKTGILSLNHKNIYISDLLEEESMQTGFGTQMHEIFASIGTNKDVQEALRRAWLKGLITSGERSRMESEINGKLQQNPFKSWFSGEYTIKSESDLLDGNGEIVRPDRVMIKPGELIILDYKFGKHKSSVYQKQLMDYARVLTDCGYKNIRAFIWYYLLNDLEEVPL